MPVDTSIAAAALVGGALMYALQGLIAYFKADKKQAQALETAKNEVLEKVQEKFDEMGETFQRRDTTLLQFQNFDEKLEHIKESIGVRRVLDRVEALLNEQGKGKGEPR